jgi:glycosyltransferase involved in cell wall biosynthesis
MKNISILYFHTLDLTFKSAQTIQVVKDYFYLSKLGIPVKIYGTYNNHQDFDDIQEYLKDSPLVIRAKKDSFFNRLTLKISFFFDLLNASSKKIVVTRTYRKLRTIFRLKQFGFKIILIHEMHEESFPYIFKENISKNYSKFLFLHKQLNLILFTNYSQQIYFEKEYGLSPKSYAVIPNGVETDKFLNISIESNYVLTYGGGFNKWKNVDLVFEALSLLDNKYTLRIAGGKGDLKSAQYINNLINKFNIEPTRVDYLGFVNNVEFPTKVLDKSNLLLIPLGENIQSQYLTSPMKLYEYMSTKIPVLAVKFPSITLVARDTIYLSTTNARNFAKKIIEICEKNIDKFDSRPMNEIAKKYSYINRSKQLYNEIKKLDEIL